MPAKRSSLSLILSILALFLAETGINRSALAAEYFLNPGDQLHISVWGEDNLQDDVLILPDGTLAFPLVGTLQAAGKDIATLRKTIARKLKPYVPDATVTVTVTATSGNLVYIIGKVNEPGTYTLIRPTDVMQALSLAGGLARFAKEDEIRILRRQGKTQRSIPFDYSKVITGEDLTTNILLESGDTIVVP
ncbi:MAG TPA: sugar ABC transporter substrate-binding protein [Gammaproteobacteria bacterium]|nr:sugar ABC transporter substrate-binding protein [Gammaproteobacteria bacterium]